MLNVSRDFNYSLMKFSSDLPNLKSKGFNFEESKLTEGYKIEKLMAFLSIAFVWSILAGDYRELEKPIVYKKKSLIE